MKVIVGITGASGAMLGIRLLEVLNELNQETYLVISEWGEHTISYETGYTMDAVRELAAKCYSNNDLSASISSGSFKTDGMVVIPCSMKTLSAVAHGFSNNLIARAADVTLKERRKLILVARETPLNSIHLKNMLSLSEMGVVIMPPIPAFYSKPGNPEEMVNGFVGRVLDQLGIENDYVKHWE